MSNSALPGKIEADIRHSRNKLTEGARRTGLFKQIGYPVRQSAADAGKREFLMAAAEELSAVVGMKRAVVVAPFAGA